MWIFVHCKLTINGKNSRFLKIQKTVTKALLGSSDRSTVAPGGVGNTKTPPNA